MQQAPFPACVIREGPFSVSPWLEGLSGCEGPCVRPPVVRGLLGAGALSAPGSLSASISWLPLRSSVRRSSLFPKQN